MEGNLTALTTVFTEFYYWVTVVFMFLIHVGFCMYEVGASRHRNHMHTLMKKYHDHSFGHSDVLLVRMVDILGLPDVSILRRAGYRCRQRQFTVGEYDGSKPG